MDTISPVYARIVLRHILDLGIEAALLLEGTSLSRHELETSADIPMEDFVQILANGRDLSGTAHLGLVIGRHSNISVMGATGVAAAFAPTLRQGLLMMENYSRLHITYLRIWLRSGLDGISIRMRFLKQTGDVERFHMEAAALVLQSYVETITCRTLDKAEYRFSIPRPDADDYTHWIHSPVSFDWPDASLELPAELLELPSPYYDAEVWRQTTLGLARRLKSLDGGGEKPYTAYVETLMRGSELPLPGLEKVARQLHMSERTLNRRLQAEGTSFREIRARMMADWARLHLLQTDASVEAIAAELGYQDAANFRRAFRRVQGCSPGAYRRMNRRS